MQVFLVLAVIILKKIKNWGGGGGGGGQVFGWSSLNLTDKIMCRIKKMFDTFFYNFCGKVNLPPPPPPPQKKSCNLFMERYVERDECAIPE